MEAPDYFPNKLHELCALTYEPASYLSFNYDGNKHAEVADKFLKAPMSIAQPRVFFCLEVLANWNLNTFSGSVNLASSISVGLISGLS